MQTNKPKIYVALPAMDEAENLPDFLSCFRIQTQPDKKLVVCVNQPDDWWQREDKVSICENNSRSLQYLNSQKDSDIEVIDKSTVGLGWKGKKYGVGWARKVVMDRVSEQAKPTDILISLDADTSFKPDYFTSVIETFQANIKAVALSVPYYHKLTGDEGKDRAILHYEIYMRYYAINLWRINNPYAFTAIGSAIALPVWAYRSIGGITPHNSGEDFYFLQKLRKFGRVLTWNPQKVYPEARYSDRVGFGTGPAMIKGNRGEWKSYPIYPHQLFDEVKKTTSLFQLLFKQDLETPMDAFNREKFGDDKIWQPLRENFKTEEKFINACHHKIDALRILQYLKWRHLQKEGKDELNLTDFMQKFYSQKWSSLNIDEKLLSFENSPVELMDNIRNLLAEIESDIQKHHDNRKK